MKDDTQYCTCRKGYDGKEFMIECDGCQEWFHGACVGLKPNSVTDHYYCKSCLKKKQKKKSIIILPLPKPEIVMPVISKLSIDQDDEDEDLCPVCDGDCTCGSEEHKTILAKHNISSSDDDSSSSSSGSGSDDSSEEEVQTKQQESKKKLTTAAPRRGKSTTLLANIIRQKAPHYASKGGKKSDFISSSQSNKLSSDEEEGEEDTDEEVVVDDLDDLLETMSPLSEHSSNESNHSSEEFFTDEDVDMDEDVDIDSSSLNMSPYPESRASYSSVHIDSGDDEDIENAETQAIIADMTLDSDEEDMDSDEGMFVEDEDDDDEEDDDNDDQDHEQNNMMSLGYYTSNNNHWSSDDDEDEEEEEFDYTTALPNNEGERSIYHVSEDSDEEKQQHNNPLLPLLDSEDNLYDSIAAAFMQSLGPMSDMQGGDTTHSANTPGIGEEYQLSPFELAHALSALSAETARQHQQNYLRRPSLPSNAVSAAQRNRGSQDFNTSEALRALSALASDELSMVPLEPIDEEETEQEGKDAPTTTTTNNTTTPSSSLSSPQDILPNQLALSLSTDFKLQEQILDILKGTESSNDKITPQANHTTSSLLEKKALLPTLNPSRQILPKPSGSGLGSAFPTMALEQQIQDALQDNIEQKRKNSLNEENQHKKRRLSRSNSLGTLHHHLQPMETNSFSTPASPAAIIDELEDLKEKDAAAAAAAAATAVSMDDLVDTSQLYTSLSRSPSPEVQDDPYSRDLSRWQRIPIGAFRLMRSKNKLWLER
ncbi:hypothetical protein INT48_005043 [Thamnidium elegans]|uniref:PHD-type domain-containing protein n=1 Tax=Thamnidium elegans TaxID=101142 RepID=A0A8H7SN94_9FUNG|nr:hypothetical protein INT48_005043 [Thamnidium elegans]